MSFQTLLVSVLITNYNYANYLKEAIDSALNQTYRELEVIVVDDGSTDQSREILSNYKDRIIPIFKENGGQASAVNAGFAISKGEIICFLDADDIWLPTKVEQVVEAAVQNPKAIVIYHKVQNIDRAGTPTGKPWPPYPVIRGDISQKVAQTGGWWPFPPSTALSFTRPFLSQVMNIPEQEYWFSAEPYLTDLAPFFGEIFGISQVLSLFRIHGSNYWSNPVDLEKRAFQNHEVRVETLNRGLKERGMGVAVNLNNHLPYQRLKYKLNGDLGLYHLTQLVWKNPWQSGPGARIKAVIRLWIEQLGLYWLYQINNQQ